MWWPFYLLLTFWSITRQGNKKLVHWTNLGPEPFGYERKESCNRLSPAILTCEMLQTQEFQPKFEEMVKYPNAIFLL